MKLNEKWRELLKIRDICNLSIEEKRANKVIGSSLEATLKVQLNNEDTKIIEGIDLAELCITSSVEIQKSDVNDIVVQTSKSKGSKCSVCWKIRESKCPRRNCGIK